MLRFSVLICFALAASSAYSATSWTGEPTTFVGIKIDQPLVGQMAECPFKGESFGKFYMTPPEGAPCYEQIGRTGRLHTLRNPPDLGFAIDTTVNLYSGNVGAIAVEFAHLKIADMLALLVAKYGQPHLTETARWTSRAGVTLNGKRYAWKGTRVTLTLDEYGTRIDQSLATLMSSKYLEALEAQKKANTESNKDKL